MTRFDERWEARRRRWENRMHRHDGKGRVWTGIFILIIGVAALMKATLTDFPDWLFSWQVLLIALGVFIGIRHQFRHVTWLILVLIGGVFLVNDIYPDFTFRRYMWPMALIIVGLFIIFKPKRRWKWDDVDEKKDSVSTPAGAEAEISSEDFIDSTNIFGGSKKNILSKNFKGGDLVNIFGGTELDLTQADFSGTAVIEVTNIFGGTKLILPSHWELKSEAVTILGGIDDKRKMTMMQEKPEKTLVLKGTILFGGIDIKSY